MDKKIIHYEANVIHMCLEQIRHSIGMSGHIAVLKTLGREITQSCSRARQAGEKHKRLKNMGSQDERIELDIMIDDECELIEALLGVEKLLGTFLTK